MSREQGRALEFFAGSGLVRIGLAPEFRTVWANDNCDKKAAVYNANGPEFPIHVGDVREIRGASLPVADLAWASFPCQDLSLAGNLNGINRGTRSGLFWQWLRVLDEMRAAGKRVPLLVAENVVGFIVADGGRHFKRAYQALRERGYRVGAMVIDARLFVPQSRPRAFIVALSEEHSPDDHARLTPSPVFHPDSIVRVAQTLDEWVWWSLPTPSGKRPTLSDICERDAACDSPERTRELRAMLSPLNKAKLTAAIESKSFLVGTGYRRTRPDDDGNPLQRLELRFDGVAGCLRTPEGGSSRQVVMIVDHGQVRSRLLTVRECARLMGAPDTYEIPGSYNDGYRAMGDAVAVPVTRWLARHLLGPLAASVGSAAATSAA